MKKEDPFYFDVLRVLGPSLLVIRKDLINASNQYQPGIWNKYETSFSKSYGRKCETHTQISIKLRKYLWLQVCKHTNKHTKLIVKKKTGGGDVKHFRIFLLRLNTNWKLFFNFNFIHLSFTNRCGFDVAMDMNCNRLQNNVYLWVGTMIPPYANDSSLYNYTC